MRTIFIDTQFVVAVGNPRDQHHGRAMDLTESCSGSRFVITEPVILEIGNACASKAKEYAIEKIDQFLKADDVELVGLTPEYLAKATPCTKAIATRNGASSIASRLSSCVKLGSKKR